MKKKLPLTGILFVAGIALAGSISYAAMREAYRSRQIDKEIEQLKQQAAQIQNENDTLSQRISYFQTPQFQEKVAKDKLNLQKPDENVVVVKPGIEKNDTPAPVGIATDTPDDHISNYAKWWNVFFKYD